MLLFYIRHGDPIYNPDSLTPQGKLQAAALAKRLALYGLNEIYSSPSVRAQLTAQPTAELLNLPIHTEPWTDEGLAWGDFTVQYPDNARNWIFADRRMVLGMREQDMLDRGMRWYESPLFDGLKVREGYQRVLEASDDFLRRLGFEHDREHRCYRVIRENNDRVALFAHQGFGLAWLGTVLDVPLPTVWTSMDLGHSSMTVINFSADADGICVPKILSLSNDSHLYREGLPTRYQNWLYF